MKRQYMYGYVFMIERGITKNIYIIWEKSVCVFINMIYIYIYFYLKKRILPCICIFYILLIIKLYEIY